MINHLLKITVKKYKVYLILALKTILHAIITYCLYLQVSECIRQCLSVNHEMLLTNVIVIS